MRYHHKNILWSNEPTALFYEKHYKDFLEMMKNIPSYGDGWYSNIDLKDEMIEYMSKKDLSLEEKQKVYFQLQFVDLSELNHFRLIHDQMYYLFDHYGLLQERFSKLYKEIKLVSITISNNPRVGFEHITFVTVNEKGKKEYKVIFLNPNEVERIKSNNLEQQLSIILEGIPWYQIRGDVEILCY